MEELLLTVEEVGQRLHLSRPVIYDLMRAGELRSITVGKSRRIAVADLAAYVEAKRAAAREAAEAAAQ